MADFFTLEKNQLENLDKILKSLGYLTLATVPSIPPTRAYFLNLELQSQSQNEKHYRCEAEVSVFPDRAVSINPMLLMYNGTPDRLKELREKIPLTEAPELLIRRVLKLHS
ncbi:MAG: hypothetical protein J4452_00730 [Candidatus Aenigmarchaeota archaeon]|nr:hypothetical protein [Candidatus Aenigmarchaeota archaeon]